MKFIIVVVEITNVVEIIIGTKEDHAYTLNYIHNNIILFVDIIKHKKFFLYYYY
jgi:hypothetical protein